MSFNKGDKALLKLYSDITKSYIEYEATYKEPCVGVYEGQHWFDVSPEEMRKRNFRTTPHIVRKSEIIKWL